MSILSLRRLSWAMIAICMLLGGLIAYGQQAAVAAAASPPGAEPPGAWLANLNATALLGMGLLSALTVLGYLLRFMAGKWVQVIEDSRTVMQGVRDELASCRAWREKQ